jgi:transposase
MLSARMVCEIVARHERGEKIRRIARELHVDRRTIRTWLLLGKWRPVQRTRHRRSGEIDKFVDLIRQHGPEVSWNAKLLHRRLASEGFAGSYGQVQRFVRLTIRSASVVPLSRVSVTTKSLDGYFG